MELMVMTPGAQQGTTWQYHLENEDAAWRCIPVQQCDSALTLLRARYFSAVLLLPGPETDALLTRMAHRPPLRPPYLVGAGFTAPDGRADTPARLHKLLATARAQDLLPRGAALPHAETARLARSMLNTLGSPPRLRALELLPDMLALTTVHPPLLTDLHNHLYPLTARRHGLTPAGVERRIRLYVESTWSHGSLDALERFFGCTVDPERGKPTNREFLRRMTEKLTQAASRLA